MTPCKATLTIGDDFGDNQATMHCQLPHEHEGKHREVYNGHRAGQVTVEWEHDDTEPEPTYDGLPDWVRPGKFVVDRQTKEAHEIMGVYPNEGDYEIHIYGGGGGGSLGEYNWRPTHGYPDFESLFLPAP